MSRPYNRRSSEEISEILECWKTVPRGQKQAFLKEHGITYSHINYWTKKEEKVVEQTLDIPSNVIVL